MSDHQTLKDQARSKTRSLLAFSQSFRNLEREEQMALYKDLVDAHYNDLAEQQGLATEMATAGDLINEERHQTPGVKESGRMMGDFVKNVDFPGFVKDLVTGVFDANLKANQQQMEAYIKLLEKATRSLSAFVNEIKDTEALVRLAQTNNEYKLKVSKIGARKERQARRKGEPTQGAEPDLVLTDKNGKEIKITDNEIQAKLLDAKLALAKERRTMLRETILMGVSRLVVEKGIIRAEVSFSIDSSQDTSNSDDAAINDTLNETKFGHSGLFGGLFGGSNSQTSRIKISNSTASSDSNTDTSLSANMSGFVEIQFKSDYFKLDNFRETFDLGQGQVAQVPAGAATQPQLPPQAAPAAPVQTAPQV